MNKKINLALLALGMAAAIGCQKPNEPDARSTANAGTMSAGITYAENDGPTVLGQQLNNPYLLPVMDSAERLLAARGIYPQAHECDVRVTHLYVKFTPQNEQELNLLESDTTLNLYDCPMDYEKLVVGTWYREPGLADSSVPTPQYAAVPASYQFTNGVGYQVLAQLYIPEQDQQLMGASLLEEWTYMGLLLNEAYSITRPTDDPGNHNFLLADPGIEGGGGGGSCTGGRIRVHDTRLDQLIGLEGVRVTANRWFTTHTGYADQNGDYCLDGSFDRPADYKIHFRRNGFSVYKNSLVAANITESNVSGNHWDRDLSDGLGRFYGTVFRAAYSYHYGDIAGLPRPGRPVVVVGIFSFEVNQVIVARNDDQTWAFLSGLGMNTIITPRLYVTRFTPGTTNEFGTDDWYSTTIHEISHTSHFNTLQRNATAFLQVNNRLRESFSVGVEWLLTSMEYQNRGIANYGNFGYAPNPSPVFPNVFAYQYWNEATYDDKYTSLFINLIDDYNEFGQSFPGFDNGTVNDQVSGYNLGFIQSFMLLNTMNLSTLKAKLSLNKPTGVTDAQLDLLFDSY
ncbi:MAG: hypothetical protein QM642_10675 [Edaphocola sp.]